MRSDNASFKAAWQGQFIRPQYVFRIDFGGADYIYLTSGPVTGLSGSNVYDSYLADNVSGTSQKINPDKSVSSIGSITFEALDVDDDLTDIQRTKLAADKGLRGKQVAFYVGEAGLSWSDFILATVQVIQNVEYDEGKYVFECSDIQRELRQDIFQIKTTNQSASITANDATIPVYTTAGFQVTRNPDSPGGVIDAPAQEVGYIKLTTGCIVRYTGVTANSFTGCTWGVLGTSDLISDIAKDPGASADDSPKIEEYIYREGPAVMIAYELMTGVVYDDQTKSLPDHWHLGIDPNYVRLTDFEGIGTDWWDTSNNDLGIAAVISGVEKVDGKKFLEEQIYTMLGAFSPIYNDGAIGLKRLQNVHSTGSYVRKLDQTDIIRATALTHDMESVINQMSIEWNYDHIEKEFTRISILNDTESQGQHGLAKPKTFKFKTLASSRHSTATIQGRFDSLRDRYAGPPLKIKVDLLPKHNDLEVGDIVRVCLPNTRDYTKSGSQLDRNFEIQQVRTDWKSGKVTLDLFGSSQIAGPITGGSGSEVLDDSWYTSAGTEISPANYPGSVSVDGSSITHIDANMTLTGNASLTNSGAIYYVDGDLTIDAGVTLTITANIQLRVKGFLQVNGTINGAGNGAAGQTLTAVNVNAQFIGNTRAGDGIEQQLAAGQSTPTIQTKYRRIAAYTLQGSALSSAPFLSLDASSGSLVGIPGNLMGSPGPKGGKIQEDANTVGGPDTYDGGDGGDSGAGLFVVCRGADIGAAGTVDTSGEDGEQGLEMRYGQFSPDQFFRSGSGGGGYCGACYWIIDGAINNAPSLTPSNSIAEVGQSVDFPDGEYIFDASWRLAGYNGSKSAAIRPYQAKNRGFFGSRENTFEVNHRIQFLS